MDEEGGNRTRIPNSWCCHSLTLSSHRTQCAYYPPTDGHRWDAGIPKFTESCEPILYLSDLDTEDLTYRWSFDDKHVAIATSYPIESDKTRMLYVVGIESGHVSAIEADVLNLSWVPGQHRLLILAGGSQGYASGWHLIDPDGTEMLFFLEGVDHVVSYVEYSPDGQRIAFVQRGSKKIVRLFVCDTDGANCTEMTPDWGEVEYDNALWPEWSPDGRRIAFIARYVESVVGRIRQWTNGTFVVDVVTGEQRLLYEGLLYLVLSPDSTEVGGVSMPGVYKLSLETGERTVLESGNSREIHEVLAWVWADEESSRHDLQPEAELWGRGQQQRLLAGRVG
jgi:WD40 repeat protein